MLDRKEIGKRIKKARELKSEQVGYKYTGQMLANELNISRSFLGDLESGRTPTPEILLSKIIKICNLPSDFFKDSLKDDLKPENLFAGPGRLIESLPIIPEEFTVPDEARVYIKKHKIFASEGFNANKLTDEEVLSFANALLEQMRLVSYKYKK